MHPSRCGTSICVIPWKGWSIPTYLWPWASRTSLTLRPLTSSQLWISTLRTNLNDHPKMPHWPIFSHDGVECPCKCRSLLGYLPSLPNISTRPSFCTEICLFLHFQPSDLPFVHCISHRHHTKMIWKIRLERPPLGLHFSHLNASHNCFQCS